MFFFLFLSENLAVDSTARILGMETAISTPLQISTGTITINQSHMNSDVMSDGISEPSSPESTTFDPHDLLANAVSDDVTAQLAASG